MQPDLDGAMRHSPVAPVDYCSSVSRAAARALHKRMHVNDDKGIVESRAQCSKENETAPVIYVHGLHLCRRARALFLIFRVELLSPCVHNLLRQQWTGTIIKIYASFPSKTFFNFI